MQAALQRHVDSSISKTINCPADISFEAFETIYLEAFDLGLKGCTAYRPNDVTGAILAPIIDARRRAGGCGRLSPGLVDEIALRKAEAAAFGAAAGAPAHTPPLPAIVHTAPAVAPPTAARHGDIVYMSQPLERDPVLAGYTYKIKWPESDHAIYVTLNDIDAGWAPPAVRDLHQHAQPRALRLDRRPHAHDQRRLPPRRRRVVRRP